MHRTLHPFICILLLITMTISTIQVKGQVSAAVLVDDEYDRYKKRADDSFREGSYHKALRQYHNCLAVSGFEKDLYTQKKIDESTMCLNLSVQAEADLMQSKGPEAVILFDQLLTINPDDGHTKSQLVNFYEYKGDRFFDDKKYVDARKSYERAIGYSVEQKKVDLSNKLTNVNKLRATSQRIKLQMATGVIAVGATAYALLLRRDYLTKTSALNQISLGAINPNFPGTIDNDYTYSTYKEAYAAAQAAERKKGLYIASIGVAAVATLAELYLLWNLPKKTRKVITWQPSAHSIGLAVSYTF